MFETNVHYANKIQDTMSYNTPMQYTAIFYGCKNHNFQMKKYDIFPIFAKNMDCGYTLEPPNENPQSMF